jgi:hypothetical protein
MRTTRLGAVLASLATTTGTLALVAVGPTQASAPEATTATLAINQHTQVKGQYGDLVGFLDATVTDSNGAGVFAGSAVLERQLPGRSWATVKTDSDGTDGFDFGSYGSHAKGNVRYRLHYLGGTDAGTSVTYAPAVSGVVKVVTLWGFKDTSACPNGHCHISGRLIPKTARHKIVVQVKHGSSVPYRVVRTSSTGSYRVGVTGSRKGTRYRMIITGTPSITATMKGYRVIRVTARTGTAARTITRLAQP